MQESFVPESIEACLKIALVLTAMNKVFDLYVTFCCQPDCSSRQSGNFYLCSLGFINLPFIFSLRERDMCMFFSRQAIHTIMILHPAPCKISIIVSFTLKLKPCFVLDKARATKCEGLTRVWKAPVWSWFLCSSLKWEQVAKKSLQWHRILRCHQRKWCALIWERVCVTRMTNANVVVLIFCRLLRTRLLARRTSAKSSPPTAFPSKHYLLLQQHSAKHFKK